MKKNRHHRIVLLTLIVTAAFWVFVQNSHAADNRQGEEIIHRKNSLYSSIFVYKYESIVTLQFKRNRVSVQSQVDLNNLHNHMLEYTQMTYCGLLYKPEPKSVLVLGLGAGVIPRDIQYYFPECQIDAVEIDPDIPPIAKKYFQFKENDTLKVHVKDGRIFIKKQLLNESVPKYDIIILDAFNGDYIPFHLLTKEFLEETKGILADDGVVVANVFSSNRLFDAELKTFLAVFGKAQVFIGDRSGNAMIASGNTQTPTLTQDQADEVAAKLQEKHNFSFQLTQVAKQLSPDIKPESDAIVLTDDRAPVNWLKKQDK